VAPLSFYVFFATNERAIIAADSAGYGLKNFKQIHSYQQFKDSVRTVIPNLNKFQIVDNRFVIMRTGFGSYENDLRVYSKRLSIEKYARAIAALVAQEFNDATTQKLQQLEYLADHKQKAQAFMNWMSCTTPEVYVFGFDRSHKKLAVCRISPADNFKPKLLEPPSYLLLACAPEAEDLLAEILNTDALSRTDASGAKIKAPNEEWEKTIDRVIAERESIFGEITRKFPLFAAPWHFALIDKDGVHSV
jgi:hypothetical protein